MLVNLIISYFIILAAVGAVYGILNSKKVLNDTEIQYLYASQKAYRKISIPAKIVIRFTKALAKTCIKIIKIMIYKNIAKRAFN